MSESQPLLRGKSATSPSLSSSLPTASVYFPSTHSTASYHSSSHTTSPAVNSGNSNIYYQALSSLSSPPSPHTQRRPLDRIHHIPPPHLNHAAATPTSTMPPSAVASPTPARRLSTLLSLSLSSSPSPSSSSVLPETKRVEVVPDRTGKPQVREEREWPKPKKDAQYDDESLFDWHSLLIVTVLLSSSVLLYTALPELVLLSNPAYVWTSFLLSLYLVYHVCLLVEMTLLKLLSLASGSRVWKVYFYSQALHETLGNVLTILYLLWCRYYCKYIVFPLEVRRYLDPTLHFALLMFIAVLVRQILTKHLTYVVNQERYAKAVQDLLFKGHVLARLCDHYAYQPLYTRPPPVAAADGSKQFEVPFPYTPLPTRRRLPIFLSASSSSSSARAMHPLYDVFLRLRDFNESLNDDYLPGGTGVSFFSSEKQARLRSKELFRNVDRDRKGYLDIHDFRAFFPRETALRAFKLFFPPKRFKVSASKKADKPAVAPPPPLPFRVGGEEEGGQAAGEGAGAGKAAVGVAGAAGGKGKKKVVKKKEKTVAAKQKLVDKMNERTEQQQQKDAAGQDEGEEKPKGKKDEVKAERKEADEDEGVDAVPLLRKSSSTILEALVADNKESAVANPATPPAAAPAASNSGGDFSAISSDAIAPPLLPAAAAHSTLPDGAVVIDAQSMQEQHLNSLHLAYSELESRILGFYEARQTLSRQLRDLDGLADVMQSLSQLLFWVIVGLMLIIVFDEHIQSVMFSVSTLLLSFTFVFATTIKDIFQAIILIFATKPYAVGDRVNIGKDKYRVHSIQLLTTTFRDLQNKLSIVPNNKLAAASIQNLTRSANVVVKMKIAVAFDTPSSKLGQLRQRIVEHVQALPMEWKPTVSMHLADLAPQLNTVNVSLLLSHLASYTQVKEWKRSKTELLHVIREEMIRLGIAWKNPESTVSIVNADSIGQLLDGVGSFLKQREDKVRLITEGDTEKAVETEAGAAPAAAAVKGAGSG